LGYFVANELKLATNLLVAFTVLFEGLLHLHLVVEESIDAHVELKFTSALGQTLFTNSEGYAVDGLSLHHLTQLLVHCRPIDLHPVDKLEIPTIVPGHDFVHSLFIVSGMFAELNKLYLVIALVVGV